jgi:thymidine kinase
MSKNKELVIHVGPMFSGKTSHMLLDVEKYKHAGREILAYKPKCDDRYAKSEIVTHMGWSYPAIEVSCGEDISKHILENVKNTNFCLIVVDELFMIPQAAEELIWLYRNSAGVEIVAASLDLSYACKPFEEVSKILPWATRIEKYVSACSVCGNDARFTYRKAEDVSEVLVGGKELYEPRCGEHHPFVKDQ